MRCDFQMMQEPFTYFILLVSGPAETYRWAFFG